MQEDQTHDRAVNYIIATPEFAKNFTTVSANLENQLIVLSLPCRKTVCRSR